MCWFVQKHMYRYSKFNILFLEYGICKLFTLHASFRKFFAVIRSYFATSLQLCGKFFRYFATPLWFYHKGVEL